ncbi:hypothetical protein L3X38_035091 [Prunus dulcis]|uniref:Uncharacterized protein n=1 Tax=Prunus dulcis TaxID=3755 RepID=A0AAD4YXH3_PRUDU|nr:hypothetical protein L3X38_035091 [Prunus dulcis]
MLCQVVVSPKKELTGGIRIGIRLFGTTCSTQSAPDETKLCEVVVSPSKELEIFELRAKNGKVNCGGSWPLTAKWVHDTTILGLSW